MPVPDPGAVMPAVRAFARGAERGIAAAAIHSPGGRGARARGATEAPRGRLLCRPAGIQRLLDRDRGNWALLSRPPGALSREATNAGSPWRARCTRLRAWRLSVVYG